MIYCTSLRVPFLSFSSSGKHSRHVGGRRRAPDRAQRCEHDWAGAGRDPRLSGVSR
jgi:hypothetical protein